MPEAFEEKKEEEKKEFKKKKKDQPAPSELKTIMEIRDIRDTAKKGREIVARREGKQVEKEEESDVKYPSSGDILASVPPSKPSAPEKPADFEFGPNQARETARSPPIQSPRPAGQEEDKKDGKKRFEDMIRKMKRFLK